ncbi:MAG: octaprenyl-diphosphate synthase, partial [Xanthomonadaceae bacterium]|nr:octaprenyl-diphosphate synthase [Xanthomonadaceae bacterium]
RRIVIDGDASGFGEVMAAIDRCDSLGYSRAVAQRHADAAVAALDALPDTGERAALAGLARYALARSH